MDIVSFQDIIRINEDLKEFGFLLMLKDMCSGQLVSIRTLQKEKTLDIPEQVYDIIDKYFKNHFIKINYNEEKTTFSIGDFGTSCKLK